MSKDISSVNKKIWTAKLDTYSDDLGVALCLNEPDCLSFILRSTSNIAYVGRDGGRGGEGNGGVRGGVRGEGGSWVLIFASLSGCSANTASQLNSFFGTGCLGCVFRVIRI